MASGQLPTSEQAKGRTVEDARQWAQAARDIIDAEGPGISARPLSERLSLAAATFEFWLDRLGYPSANDTVTLHRLADELPGTAKDALAQDFQKQATAFGALTVPEAYFEFMNRVCTRAYEAFMETSAAQDLMPAWCALASEFIDGKTGAIARKLGKTAWTEKTGKGEIMTPEARERLDAAGITHGSCVKAANIITAALNNAFIHELAALGIHADMQPMEVEGFKWADASAEDRARENSTLQRQPGAAFGGSFFRVSDRAVNMLDPRSFIGVAFHEPQHAMQFALIALKRSGVELPAFLDETASIFALRRDFDIRNCSPSVFFVGNGALQQAAMDAYRMDRTEETAIHQGYCGEKLLHDDFRLPVSDSARFTFTQWPERARRMPPDRAGKHAFHGMASAQPA